MDSIIEIRGLSKRYRLGRSRTTYDNFRELLMRTGRLSWARIRRKAVSPHSASPEFWALRHLDLDVFRGDTLGIIGPNGAGKTTLLKIISRITDPTEGYVRVRGRTASLLEVGTGFHPELTGRENVFLNGAILGMKKREIDARFDEIVDFSGLGEFLDTPVKRYSSGMYVRLAFAVAAHLESDILIADEVLSVGDAVFQRKCLGKMAEARARAKSVLFVSHNLAAIESICTRGLVLDRGAVAFLGPVRDAVQYYLRNTAQEGREESYVADLNACAGRPPGFQPLLRRLELHTPANQPLRGPLPTGSGLKVIVEFELENPTPSFHIALWFESWTGQRICTAHSGFDSGCLKEERAGTQVFVCTLPHLPLMPGYYRLGVSLEIGGRNTDQVDDAMRLRIVGSDYYGTGMLPEKGAFLVENRWTLQ